MGKRNGDRLSSYKVPQAQSQIVIPECCALPTAIINKSSVLAGPQVPISLMGSLTSSASSYSRSLGEDHPTNQTVSAEKQQNACTQGQVMVTQSKRLQNAANFSKPIFFSRAGRKKLEIRVQLEKTTWYGRDQALGAQVLQERSSNDWARGLSRTYPGSAARGMGFSLDCNSCHYFRHLNFLAFNFRDLRTYPIFQKHCLWKARALLSHLKKGRAQRQNRSVLNH